MRLLTCTEPCAWPTVPGLWGPCLGSGLEVIWWDASVIAYACRCTGSSHSQLCPTARACAAKACVHKMDLHAGWLSLIGRMTWNAPLRAHGSWQASRCKHSANLSAWGSSLYSRQSSRLQIIVILLSQRACPVVHLSQPCSIASQAPESATQHAQPGTKVSQQACPGRHHSQGNSMPSQAPESAVEITRGTLSQQVTSAHLQHGNLKGCLQLVQRGCCQAAAAAADEAQGRGIVLGVVLGCPRQQHLEDMYWLKAYCQIIKASTSALDSGCSG